MIACPPLRTSTERKGASGTTACAAAGTGGIDSTTNPQANACQDVIIALSGIHCHSTIRLVLSNVKVSLGGEHLGKPAVLVPDSTRPEQSTLAAKTQSAGSISVNRIGRRVHGAV